MGKNSEPGVLNGCDVALLESTGLFLLCGCQALQGVQERLRTIYCKCSTTTASFLAGFLRELNVMDK